jgi:hypothetical protein
MPRHAVNPYESPSQPPDPHTTSPPEVAVREGWLVRASLLMAILLELPICGADPSGFALSHHDVQLFLWAKAICLPVILVPLLRYLWVNGRRGVIAAKGAVVTISVIVIGRLVLESGAWGYYFLNR